MRTLGLGLILLSAVAIVGCQGAPPPTSTPPPTTAPPPATTAPAPSPTAVPPTAAPTVAPTTAPTVAPTTAPTVAPTTAAAATKPAAAASPAASPAAASSAASPAAGADAKGALSEIFTGFAGVKTFRAKIAGKLAQPGAPATNMEMEVVLPDRIRGKMGVSGQSMEIVMISGATYMKVGPSPWIRAPATVPVDLNVLDPKRYDATTVSNVRLVGPEVVDGTPTLAYTYEIVSPAVPPAKTATTLNAKMWVGAADKLPRKLEMTSPDGSVTTVTYSDYNAPITIEAPL